MYDRLAESVRLIEQGVPDERVGLSRRRRFQPVAVDVDGDVAVTAFLFRAHGGAQWDNNSLARRDGEWRLLGGGGGGGHDLDELLRAPTCASMQGAHARSERSGGTAVDTAMRRDGWMSYAAIDVCEHVEAMIDRRGRHIAIPWHRRTVVLWPGQRPRTGHTARCLRYRHRDLRSARGTSMRSTS